MIIKSKINILGYSSYKSIMCVNFCNNKKRKKQMDLTKIPPLHNINWLLPKYHPDVCELDQ